jgi:periplasmic divalent cation tolerance protein
MGRAAEQNTGKLVVLVTCGSRAEARKIARVVVEARLAACVNMLNSPVDSVYRWKGKVESANEFLLVMKTTTARFGRLRDAILKAHSYEVPEIVALPISRGSNKYLDWIAESVR